MWFRKLSIVWLSLFAVSIGPLEAIYHALYSDVCEDSGSCGSGFEIGVDFLWWKPNIDDLNYAVKFQQPFSSPAAGNVLVNPASYKYIGLEWEPGVRGYISKEDFYSGWNLLGSYTWINAKHHNSFSTKTAEASSNTLFSTLFNDNIIDQLGQGDALGYLNLSAKYSLQYQTFDVIFGTEYKVHQNGQFQPIFGVTGIFLDQYLHSKGDVSVLKPPSSTTETLVNSLYWQNKYWGVGLRLGGEYRYGLWGGVDFFVRASAAIVTGESTTKRVDFAKQTITPLTPAAGAQTITIFSIPTRDNENNHFLNGYHITAGFLYQECWCDLDFKFRFGYEFVKWHNLAEPRRYASNTIESPLTTGEVASDSLSPTIGLSASPDTITLGFHGLFMGISIGF